MTMKPTDTETLDIFSRPNLRGMVRNPDHATSVAAATVIERKLTVLHAAVLHAFRELGPMTDYALETLSRFEQYGPSTIRKRRSELFQRGDLVEQGTARVQTAKGTLTTMKVWCLKPETSAASFPTL